MADKLHTLTSNLIRFAAGEKPSADKFNAANEYFARSLREISRAIGDIRDQGYPHSSNANKYTHLTGAWNPYEAGREEGRPLDIVNIARLIGPASNLNPKMLDFDTTKLETIPGSLMEYELSFPLKENGTISIIIAGVPLTKVTTPYFTGANQFLVRGNVVYFSSSHNGNRAIIYDTSASDIDGGANYTGASFNVIPDPNQPTKLSVVALQNEVNAYSVSLGACTHQQSGIRNQESLRLSSLNAGEYNSNIALKLPTWMWSGSSPRFANGDAIPEGFLVLKNLTTNEVYQNASYFFVSASQIIIRGVSLCVDHKFCIITVGTDITTSIDDLRNKMFLHKHDGSFGEPRVSVKDLIDKFTEFSSVLYGESSIPNNHFPMYLHRSAGLQDDNLNNGKNAMLGSLAMGSTGFNSLNPVSNPPFKSAPADSLSTGYASQPILFSSPDCLIKREDDATLLIKNSIHKNIDIEAKNINLTSTAEIILNAPGGLSLNSLGGFGFINLYSSSVDVGSENLLYLHGSDVRINAKNIINSIAYTNNPNQWGKFIVEGAGSSSEIICSPLEGVYLGGKHLELFDRYNKPDDDLTRKTTYLEMDNLNVSFDKLSNNQVGQLSQPIEKEIKRGKITKDNSSIFTKTFSRKRIELEIDQESVGYFDSALLINGDYADSAFQTLLSNANYLNYFETRKSLDHSHPSHIIRAKNYRLKDTDFEGITELITVFKNQSISSSNDFTRFDILINEEDVDFKIKQSEILGETDTDKEILGIIGNIIVNFKYEIIGYGNLNKRRLLINKKQKEVGTITSFSSSIYNDLINYLIEIPGSKFINFKLINYQSGSTYEKDLMITTSSIDLFDLLFSANQFENLDAEQTLLKMNDLDFEIDIIEDFKNLKINIVGRYYA